MLSLILFLISTLTLLEANCVEVDIVGCIKGLHRLEEGAVLLVQSYTGCKVQVRLDKERKWSGIQSKP